MSNFKFTFFLIVLAAFPYWAFSTIESDSLIVDAVKRGNVQKVTKLINEGLEINKGYGEKNVSLLGLCSIFRQDSLLSVLISKGANVEYRTDGKTPLIYAAAYNSEKCANVLLNYNANINAATEDGNTAFHIAAKYRNLDVLKVLYTRGANINKKDNNGYTALDYAKKGGREEIINFLVSIGSKTYKKRFKSCYDGPFITEEDNKLNVLYLIHDSLKNKTKAKQYKVKRKGDVVNFKVYEKDNFQYNIIPVEKEKTYYSNVDKIVAIGDIHGQYERMIVSLQNSGVIDNNNKWIFGNGHLVFIGDIFDRGEKVTEALWFIYHLEQEAKKSGGKVHLLFGNHELMIFDADERYLAEKHYVLTDNTGQNYSKLFGANTILGQWLRSKNTAIKINDNIFVHAGISPKFSESKISLDSLNNSVRDFYNGKYNNYPEDYSDLILRSFGPFWYRGYFKTNRRYEKITISELDNILNQYSSNTIIVGHSEVDTLQGMLDNKVIAINIPLADKEIENQALLIENGKYYRIFNGGKQKEVIK